MPSVTSLFQSSPLAFSIAGVRIDSTAGIIRDVSVITQGPALGHGMEIDAVTIEQMKAAAETYPGGLKVKISTGKGHQGDFAEIVGALRSFRIVGNKLLADLHLLDSAEFRGFVLEVAAKLPGSVGLSVEFSGAHENRDGVKYARCTEIYAASLVGDAAANPTGLFSRRFDELEKTKGTPPATITTQMENDLLAKIGELIDSKLKVLTTSLDSKIATLETAQKTSLSKIEEVSALSNAAADKAALAAVKEFSKTLGAPAGGAAAPSAPATAPVVEKFEALVKASPKYAAGKKADAMKEVIIAKPAVYRDYLNRCQAGETVMI